MDALILSCGTGGGHNAAGKAIAEELKKRGHRVRMFNPYTLKSERLAHGIDSTYIASARNTPQLFGAVYHLGNAYRRLPCRSPVYFVNAGMVERMAQYLRRHPAEVVFLPHLFPAEIFANMKARGIAVPKTVFVATDYVCTPFTEETACDAYVIPAADLRDEFVRRGIPAEKLQPLGIPTLARFADGETREQAKRRLGLDESKRYILITGGSMGGGTIKRTVRRITAELAGTGRAGLIVVCGSNRALYEELTAKPDPDVTVVGYTHDMAGYMKAADLFITKPGGLSSTEAAVCGVPILHTGAIPGCETCNTHYFSRHGMSIPCLSAEEVPAVAMRLLRDETACKQMIAHQRRCINPHAAADICTLGEQLIIK